MPKQGMRIEVQDEGRRSTQVGWVGKARCVGVLKEWVRVKLVKT